VRWYRSGSDITLEFAGERQRFSHADFTDRVVRAAESLGICAEGAMTPELRADLVALATAGRLDQPSSAAGRALAEPDEACYWLRKLVFRGAWIDGRVEVGVVEARYDERRGAFDYRIDSHPVPAARTDDIPRIAPAVFRVE
jgi:hypothetical protein